MLIRNNATAFSARSPGHGWFQSKVRMLNRKVNWYESKNEARYQADGETIFGDYYSIFFFLFYRKEKESCVVDG